jgi:hypothetical protein
LWWPEGTGGDAGGGGADGGQGGREGGGGRLGGKVEVAALHTLQSHQSLQTLHSSTYSHIWFGIGAHTPAVRHCCAESKQRTGLQFQKGLYVVLDLAVLAVPVSEEVRAEVEVAAVTEAGLVTGSAKVKPVAAEAG